MSACLVDGLLNLRIAGVIQDHNLFVSELKAAQTRLDNFYVVHGFLNVWEAWFAFNIAQLSIFAAANHNSYFGVCLEEGRDGHAHQEFIF